MTVEERGSPAVATCPVLHDNFTMLDDVFLRNRRSGVRISPGALQKASKSGQFISCWWADSLFVFPIVFPGCRGSSGHGALGGRSEKLAQSRGHRPRGPAGIRGCASRDHGADYERSARRTGIRHQGQRDPAGCRHAHDGRPANRGAPDTRGVAVPSSDARGTIRDPANVAPFVLLLLGNRLHDRTGEAFAVVWHQVTQVRPLDWAQTIRSDGPWDLDDLAVRVGRNLVPTRAPELSSWPPQGEEESTQAIG